MRAGRQRLRAGIDARLNAQREAVAQRVDLLDDRLRLFHLATAPAHDLQHRAENFLPNVGDTGHFIGRRENQVCY